MTENKNAAFDAVFSKWWLEKLAHTERVLLAQYPNAPLFRQAWLNSVSRPEIRQYFYDGALEDERIMIEGDPTKKRPLGLIEVNKNAKTRISTDHR